MNMMQSRGIPAIMSALCAVVVTVLTGCSESSTGPLNPAGNAFGVNATVVAGDPVSADEAAAVRANVQQNADDTVAVQADEVIRIAVREMPDAEVLEIRLDYDRDELNYECVVRSGGRVYVIVISPKDGTVKEKKEVREYYYTGTITIDVNVVPVRRACDRAREIVDGDVVEANLEQVEGEPVYIIIILTRENRYVTFYIDARTGKEKKLKNENRCRGANDSSMVDTANGGADSVHSHDCEDRHKNKRGRGHYRHGKGKGYGHYFHCRCNCDCDDDDGENGGDSLQVITKDSARVVVQGMFAETAAVGDITLNRTNDSTAYYETVVEDGDNRYEVTLNARTGALVEVTQTRGDFENGDYEPPTVDEGKALVAFSVARTAALAQLAGTIQSWTLARNESENRWVYTLMIEDSTTTTVKTLRVDAETGLFIDIAG